MWCRMQRNFEPMRKQVEVWQKNELTDVTAKVVIYPAGWPTWWHTTSPSAACRINSSRAGLINTAASSTSSHCVAAGKGIPI